MTIHSYIVFIMSAVVLGIPVTAFALGGRSPQVVQSAQDKNEGLMKDLYDNINGYTIEEGERRSILDKGGEPTYGEITYDSAKKLFKDLKLTSQDVFYDLGSGVGKVVVQVYLTTPVKKCVGVELAKTRHDHALAVRNKLKNKGLVKNKRELHFKRNDITEEPLSDATLVYMCSTCFSPELMQKITDRLAKLKPGLRVITLKKLPEHPKFTLEKEYKLPMTWYPDVSVYLYRLKK